MLQKATLLVVICMLISLAAQSQLLTESGFIVTNKKDTVFGKIRVSTPAIMSVKVIFFPDSGGEKRKYEPFQIHGYGFTKSKEFYESKIYDIDPSLNYGYGVFMEKLNDGPLKVYKYWNTDQEKGFTQTFLENKGRMTELNAFGFKKQMAKYFDDYSQLKDKISRGVYKRKHLKKIVAEYNVWAKDRW